MVDGVRLSPRGNVFAGRLHTMGLTAVCWGGKSTRGDCRCHDGRVVCVEETLSQRQRPSLY